MKLRTYVLSLTIGLTLTGCGGDEDTNTEKPTEKSKPIATENEKAEQYISPLPDDAPVYKVGIAADYSPFEFKNEYGKVVGYDVDIVRAIGEEAGFKVDFYDMPFDRLETSLAAGKYDFGMSSTFKNTGSFITSNSYLRSHTSIMVKKDSPYNTLEDLKGKKVSTSSGSILEVKVSQMSVTAVPETTVFLAIQKLFSGKADAAFGEDPILLYHAQEFKEYPVRIIPTDNEEMQRMVWSAAENKQEIITKVNEGLQKLKSNGRYQEINKKWFGENIDKIAVE